MCLSLRQGRPDSTGCTTDFLGDLRLSFPPSQRMLVPRDYSGVDGLESYVMFQKSLPWWPDKHNFSNLESYIIVGGFAKKNKGKIKEVLKWELRSWSMWYLRRYVHVTWTPMGDACNRFCIRCGVRLFGVLAGNVGVLRCVLSLLLELFSCMLRRGTVPLQFLFCFLHFVSVWTSVRSGGRFFIEIGRGGSLFEKLIRIKYICWIDGTI